VNLATCTTNLNGCNGSLATTTSSLTTCNSGLNACNSDKDACHTDLNGCTANFADCTATLASVGSGTASVADVLNGTTFSSAAGIGQIGAMPNNGAITIVPGTSPQTIPAGYHNGAGSVAGDSDLTPDHISTGIVLFGVEGTFIGHGLPATGETTSWGPGSDGDVQKGAVRSFTLNGDGTTTDNATGLTWENKTSDGSIHDYTKSFTWGTSGNVMDGTISSVFLATLNGGGGFAGHSDWRIPNVYELTTLWSVSAATSYPPGFPTCQGPQTCTGIQCDCGAQSMGKYWTSTTSRMGQGNAMYLDFSHSNITFGSKSNAFWVRAVRGG